MGINVKIGERSVDWCAENLLIAESQEQRQNGIRDPNREVGSVADRRLLPGGLRTASPSVRIRSGSRLFQMKVRREPLGTSNNNNTKATHNNNITLFCSFLMKKIEKKNISRPLLLLLIFVDFFISRSSSLPSFLLSWPIVLDYFLLLFHSPLLPLPVPIPPELLTEKTCHFYFFQFKFIFPYFSFQAFLILFPLFCLGCIIFFLDNFFFNSVTSHTPHPPPSPHLPLKIKVKKKFLFM